MWHIYRFWLNDFTEWFHSSAVRLRYFPCLIKLTLLLQASMTYFFIFLDPLFWYTLCVSEFFWYILLLYSNYNAWFSWYFVLLYSNCNSGFSSYFFDNLFAFVGFPCIFLFYISFYSLDFHGTYILYIPAAPQDFPDTSLSGM